MAVTVDSPDRDSDTRRPVSVDHTCDQHPHPHDDDVTEEYLDAYAAVIAEQINRMLANLPEGDLAYTPDNTRAGAPSPRRAREQQTRLRETGGGGPARGGGIGDGNPTMRDTN